MMLFSAIPWTLAGGLLGPFAAAGVGILSGLMRGVWDTHSLFTTIEMGLMAVMFAVANRQRYRTLIFRLLRQPLFSALSLVLVHAFLFILSAFFTVSTSASVTQRLDYAFSNLGVVSLAFGGEMLIAGLVAQFVSAALPRRWGTSALLQPSPAEKSIETRFISGAGTIISLLLDHTARRRLDRRRQGGTQSVKETDLKVLRNWHRRMSHFSWRQVKTLLLQIASDPRFQESQRRPKQPPRRTDAVHSLFQPIGCSRSFQSCGPCQVSV